jgi:osmotically-inducible protein OsmY
MLHTASDLEIEPTSTFEVRGGNPACLVAARLRRSGYPHLRGIKCRALDGAIALAGRVPTFHLKQIAHALASHTPGVHRVENRLEVTSSSSSTRFVGRAET